MGRMGEGGGADIGHKGRGAGKSEDRREGLRERQMYMHGIINMSVALRER